MSKRDRESDNVKSSIVEKLNAEIEQLSKKEAEEVFAVLRRRIVELRTEMTHKQLRAFQKGDVVSFSFKGETFQGTVKSVNAKSVSIDKCRDGRKWRVHPSKLTRINP